MTSGMNYPISLLRDGPLFIDELARQPQIGTHDVDFDSLRLVPSKSAASGVYTIYFVAEHREWALVRLARRYRALFEIQLHRGMSGEHQLLRQGFTSEDIEFLQDIIPQPPISYSTIAYDMLWLIAMAEEYLLVAKALANKRRFIPSEVLQSTEGLSLSDESFFKRFLRSHIIRPHVDMPRSSHRRSNPEKGGRSIDLHTEYEVTTDGMDALEGIVSEYERIFEQQNFEPLLINQNLDPRKHIKAYEAESESSTPTVSFDELRAEPGILGDIADAFSSVDDDLPDSEESTTSTTNSSKTKTSERIDQREYVRTVEDGALDPVEAQPSSSHVSSEDNDPVPQSDVNTEYQDDVQDESVVSERQFGAFSRDEIIDATVAAARVISAQSLVSTDDVKAAAWDEIDLSDRSRGELWEQVLEVLMEMDSVHGRPGGRLWAAHRFNHS